MLCAGEKFEGGVGLGSMDDSVGREGGAARRGAGRSEAEGVGGRVGEGGGAERGGERGSGRGRGEPIRLQYAYSYIQLYTRTYLLGWGTRGFRGELPLPPRAKQGRMMVRIGWRLWTVSRDKNASRRTARQHAFYAGPFADFVWQVRCVVLATGAEPKAAPVPNALSAEKTFDETGVLATQISAEPGLLGFAEAWKLGLTAPTSTAKSAPGRARVKALS